MTDNIKKALERSSLGTRKAVAARRTVSRAAAAKVVQRSEVRPHLGGKGDAST